MWTKVQYISEHLDEAIHTVRKWKAKRERERENEGVGWVNPSKSSVGIFPLPSHPNSPLPQFISRSLPSSTFLPLFKIPWVDNVFPGSPTASQCPWLSGDQTLRSIGPLLAALARCLSLAPSALRYVNILCDGEGEKKKKRPPLISTSKQPEMLVIIRKVAC